MIEVDNTSAGTARELMVRGLKRTLVGPSGPEDTDWVGKGFSPTLITTGWQAGHDFPIGPWVSGDANGLGEEVIQKAPIFVYSIGALYPEMASVQIDAITNQTKSEESLEADAQALDFDTDQVIEVIEEPEISSESDDEVIDEKPDTFGGSRPQSIALSVRTKNGLGVIDLIVRGGHYRPINVGVNWPWWRRESVNISCQLPASDGSRRVLEHDELKLTVGVAIRPYGDGTKICTVWVRNDSVVEDPIVASLHCLFQAELIVHLPEVLPYKPTSPHKQDSLDLLYQNEELLAIGHGTDVVVETNSNGVVVRSESMPVARLSSLTPDIGTEYAVGMRDLGEMNSASKEVIELLIERYGQWIQQMKSSAALFNDDNKSLGLQHVALCEQFLSDIRFGWDLMQSQPDVKQCLADASIAMDCQRTAYEAPERFVSIDKVTKKVLVEGQSRHIETREQSKWRPFQIAFILASLAKTIDPNADSRSSVDVIWMPTGGGKTEAYLGLAAFTILWERRQQTNHNPDAKVVNTKVFMRYTLRLLTIQQLTRAASLICALEMCRRRDQSRYGRSEIRIGAWLGSATTPNDWKSAVKRLEDSQKNQDGKNSGFALTKCPWCAAKIGHIENRAVFGYKIVPVIADGRSYRRMLAYCPDETCDFSFREELGAQKRTLYRGLPVFEVDEDAYRYPPDFIVGTIDKVAMMAWRPEAQSMFGLRKGKRKNPPPTLFIQDELHLIAGPLGSIDGLFELMLEHLCEVDGGYRPVVVAATATTKNYSEQVKNLYNRTGRVIPPPGLSIDDSFFARRDPNSLGKIYVGLCAQNHIQTVNMQLNALAVLAHHAPALGQMGCDPDPYWTNVVFFSSRRSLGMLNSAVETRLRVQLRKMYQQSGVRSGPTIDEREYKTRLMGRVRELTATSSEDVGQVLAELNIGHGGTHPIDLCFATSMVEVGLDVQRLGLMTVMGQPKSASQYIQVTGRVGRSSQCPGLVVTVLNPNVARDRSHYEAFSAWHRRLYASVESASVTPFTGRALERSAPTVLTTLIRALGAGNMPSEQIDSYWDRAAGVLRQRATDIGGNSLLWLNRVLDDLLRTATSPLISGYGWDRYDGNRKPFVYQMGTIVPADRLGTPYWQALTSMRSVEPDANMKISSFDSPETFPIAERGEIDSHEEGDNEV